MKDVTENASMDTFDATNNASFKMDSTKALATLAEPLKKHKGIKKLILVECEITDHGCEVLKEILSENHTIEELILEKNKITSDGARMLAEGLAKNHGVRTLNLLQQNGKSFGDDCLSKFIDMYHNNITLTKITWRLDSRKSFALAKLLTRNIEIRKRFDAQKDYTDLLPDHMKDCPPDLNKSGDERAKNAINGSTDKAPPTKESSPVEAKNGYPTPEQAPPAATAPEPVAAPAPAPEPVAAAAPEPVAAPAPAAAAPEPVEEKAAEPVVEAKIEASEEEDKAAPEETKRMLEEAAPTSCEPDDSA